MNLGLVSAAVVLALDWRGREAFCRTTDPLVRPSLLVLRLRSPKRKSSVLLVWLHLEGKGGELEF